MIEIKILEIAGMASVLQALRLPFGKECRSEVDWQGTINEDYQPPMFQYESKCFIDERDLKLLSTLVKRGEEHSKCVRGLIVYAEITAPVSWWSEADTYRIGTERLSSTSTMHTIGNGCLSIRDFNVPQIIYDILDPEYKAKEIQPLRIDEPEELKSVTREYFGRKYEIWNNGDIYALPFDTDEILPNGSKRSRHFEKTKLKTGKTRNQQGYYQVRLGGRNGKTVVLHRILAECFVENPNGYNVVNHIDGNKGNCSISNLEWCTSSFNNKHAFETGLKEITLRQKYLHYKRNLKWTDEDIRNWKYDRGQGLTLQEIADKYGTCISVVSHYTNGSRFDNMSEYSMWFDMAKYYEDTINQINDLASLYKDTDDFEYVIRIKEILPTSFIQKRIQMFSYQTLRRIYIQRRNHRLPMWHDFCSWIESLPFANELILVGLNLDKKEE